MRRLLPVVVLAAALASPALPARATTEFSLARVAGDDRFATAAAVASATTSAAPHVVLATGRTSSDALAGAHLGVPLLLTEVGSLPASTSGALDALGAERVTLLGGPAAIGAAVEAELVAAGYDVTRVAGGDRYETAARIAAAGPGATEVDGTPTAIIASGERAADAVAAGPLAARGLPILLTASDHLPASTATALDELGIGRALVLGGPASVGESVAGELAARDIEVVRLAGADRTATATAVADWAIEALGFGADHVTLARGDAFADALAGGPFGGSTRTVTLLTASSSALGDATASWLTAHAADLTSGSVLGGPGAVSDAVVAQATAAGRGQATTSGAGGGALAVAITGGLANGAYTADTSPTWSGTASAGSDAVARVEAAVDRGSPSTTGVTCTGCGGGDATWSYTAPALADGAHTVALTAVSRAGARSEPATVQVVVDTVQPGVAKAASARGSDVVTVSFTEPVLCSSTVPSAFHATVDGATSTVRRVACTGTASAPVAVTIGAPVSAGQVVKIAVDAVVTDRAGNKLGATRTATATTAGSDAPSLTVTDGPGDQSFTNRKPPNWRGDVTSARKVTRVEVGLDGAALGPASTMYCTGCPGTSVTWWYHPPSALPDGAHTVRFRAVDEVGVFSTVITIRFTVDTVAPSVSALAASVGDPTVTMSFSEPMLCSTVAAADFSATIAGAAVAVQGAACDGSASPAVAITLARAPADGEQVAVKPVDRSVVTDRAGNALVAANQVSVTVRAVDTKAPTFDSISAGSLPDTVLATFSETIASCPGDSFRVTIDGTVVGVTASCGSPSVELKLPTGTVLSSGDHVAVTVTGPVADAAGNRVGTGVTHEMDV